MPYLAKEIVSNILVRLPGSAVVRLRCVCKEWYDIIAKPCFVKTHCQTQSQNQNQNQSHQRILVAYTSHRNGIQCSVRSSQNASREHFAFHAHIPLGHSSPGDVLVGSCNGLVCVSVLHYPFSTMLYLFNPLTGQCRRVPSINSNVQTSHLGFGYDESTDDYKLVCIAKHVSYPAENDNSVSVCSLRDECWRRVGSTSVSGRLDILDGQSVSLNGALHWIGRKGSWYSHRLICFDMAGEKVRMFEVADGIVNTRAGTGRVVLMTVLKGCIALISEGGGERSVWVMKEYGVADSWSKLHVFEHNDTTAMMWPFGITANAQLLLANMSFQKDQNLARTYHIFSYDSTTNQAMALIDSLHSCAAVPYFETLVSL